MEIRLNTEFGSMRCKLGKMEPGVAFIYDSRNMAFGRIEFENHRLIYIGVNAENQKTYNLLRKA